MAFPRRSHDSTERHAQVRSPKVAEMMAPLPVLNRAFGGSRTGEQLSRFEQVVMPYAPKVIVYYCGSNVLTLRHCFTHATALDGHEEWGGMHNPWLDNVIANASDALRPGQIHNYNGMGYDLAGKVMEIVSGKSVFRLMGENLFDPLGMSHTGLEEDLGFGCFSTAADMAKLGQLLLNRGAYGDRAFFSPQTFEQILPRPLSRFYPAIPNKEWGIGLTWMRQKHPEAGTNGIPKGATVLSRNVIGHGSATAAILRVDLDNELLITQSRRRGGPDYDKQLTRLLLAIESGLTGGATNRPATASTVTGSSSP